MIRRLLVAALLLVTALWWHPDPAGAAEPEPVDLVRPFVGMQNNGNTFPGASAPFGMVQVSPDTVRPPVSCAGGIDGVCAVDLAAERTVDGTATVAQPAQGNFDGGGWSYDAGLLPATGPVTWAGTAYLAPDPTGTAKNFVQATGQSLLVTPAAHGSAKLVATTHDGPVTGTVTLGYADGSTSSAVVTVADWCGTAATGTTSLLAMPHRIKAGKGVDGPPVNLFGVRLPLTAGKQLRSITLPKDPRLHLYAVTLD